MPARKTYFLKTYGCQANKADSEKIAGWYKSQGYLPAQNIWQAEVVVINTCSVRQSAEDRVYGLINNLTILTGVTPVRGLPFKGPKIVLTGCMLRYPPTYLKKKLPQVDEFKKMEEFTQNSPWENLIIRNSKTQAWVPISQGCNNFCTYCVVPYARGREKSRSFEEVVCEVEELARRGYKEITLLGQNVNSYGKDFKNSNLKTRAAGSPRSSSCEAGKAPGDTRQISKLNLQSQNLEKYKTPFAKLLAVLNQIPGLRKIKFLTSNPWDLTDDIIEAMKLPKIERYLHLPVQSGDDEILRRMNRKYTAKDYLYLVKKIRQKFPEIKIGTDIIVGFPGETEEQFQNTVDLCQKVEFQVAYIAQYSPRPGTTAYKFADDVPYQEKKRRWEILEELINKKRQSI